MICPSIASDIILNPNILRENIPLTVLMEKENVKIILISAAGEFQAFLSKKLSIIR